MAPFTALVSLEQKSCGRCGGVFALNAEFLKHARDHRGGYFCPYCQTWWSWSESEADRLRKQLEEKSRELTIAKSDALRNAHAAADERAAKRKLEKKLRRVKAGVCPCCNRTFQNLARHMANKHPDSETMKFSEV